MTSTLGVGRPLDTSDMAALIMLPGLRVQPYSSLPTNTLPLNNTWMCNGWVGGHIQGGSPHLKAPPTRAGPLGSSAPLPLLLLLPRWPPVGGFVHATPPPPSPTMGGRGVPPQSGCGEPESGVRFPRFWQYDTVLPPNMPFLHVFLAEGGSHTSNSVGNLDEEVPLIE
jgi:hypothetical protein